MKTIANIFFTLTTILLVVSDVCAQPGPPGGGMGGPPCWPPSSCDPAIPLNNGLIFLLIAGLALTYFFFKKRFQTS